MILVGIDDTDVRGGPGTNQLARRLAAALPPGFEARLILRHQLLADPRVPCTTHNGSASLLVLEREGVDASDVIPALRREMRAAFQPGSDPGLCVAEAAPGPELLAFGPRCKRELVRPEEARALAARAGVHLEGLGGTEDGVVGALAAVSLLAGADDGRVVHLPGWTWPDTFAGPQTLDAVRARGVDEVLERGAGRVVTDGQVDVGRHLRPAYRAGRVVLFVEKVGAGPDARPLWRALKLP